MLVLSRKKNEKIVVPTLGVTIEVIAVSPSTVKIGISAPPDVDVARAELPRRKTEWADDPMNRLRRMLRERLRVTGVGLAELRRQLDAGQTDDAHRTLDSLADDVRLLVRRLESENRSQPPTPVKALLVEDDAGERRLLASYLRNAGLDVDTAGDGADALDHLHTSVRPDVVLLDMGLPRCDGAATLRAIRHDPACRDVKVFAVSGHRPEEYHLTADLIDGWFCKPVDPEELVKKIDRALHEARTEI
jgi:carbon storage regulator CsrA